MLKFVMFLFYRYYSKGGTFRIPYFSALCATVFLIYIHIFQVLIILRKVDWLPMIKGDLRIINYGKLALFLLPVFLIVGLMVKERDLKNVRYDEQRIKKGGIFLIIYIIITILLLFTLMFLFKK